MLEKEIQFITDFNLNKINKPGSQLTFEKFLRTDVHPAILQYISGELDYQIFEDRHRLLENSDFDYSGSRIGEYFNLIAGEIKRNKKLSSDEIKKFVEKAVVFNLNYVTQPGSIFKQLVFRDKRNSKSVSEIHTFFNFIYYYDYIKDIFSLYLEKRKAVSLNVRELEVILNKIDNELFASKPEELVNDALVSIVDFYNQGSINKTVIPVNLIENFLKEKKLDGLITRLYKAFPDTKREAEIDELKFILFSKTFIVDTVEEIKSSLEKKEEIKPDAAFVKEEFKSSEKIDAEETTPGKEEITPPEIEEKRIIKPSVEEKQETKNPEPVKEVKKAGHKLLYDEIEFEAIDEDAEQKDSIENKSSLQQSIIEENEELIEESGDLQRQVKKRTKDIFSFLSDREIERIVSEVFNEDRDDFANTLEKLSDANSYVGATDILKSVFTTYNINPFSKEAITLTNAVSNYFHQAE